MSIEFISGLVIGFLIGVVLMCLIKLIKRPKKNEAKEELIVFKHRIDKEISVRNYMGSTFDKRLR